MATTLYVTSTKRFSGKTALCVGLATRLREKGLVTGYMKPISTTARAIGERIEDEDAVFIRSVLGQTDPLDLMVPLILSEQEARAALERTGSQEVETRIKDAHRAISENKDVVIMEGGSSLREGWIVNLAPPRIAQVIGARTLVVVPYQNTLQAVDDLLAAHAWFGGLAVGAVINSVPQYNMGLIQDKVKPYMEKRGLPVLAVIPRNKVLMSISIRELVDELGGKVLCCQHADDELVETLMVGAMSAESALTHFRRGVNKVVITGGDRPDIQLAALETSTRCLILTGNLQPSSLIIGLAEERGVPIVLSHYDTMKTMEIVEGFFGKTRFHQPKKVEHFKTLLEKHMDFAALGKALGLPAIS